jgi:hypothetical protein
MTFGGRFAVPEGKREGSCGPHVGDERSGQLPPTLIYIVLFYFDRHIRKSRLVIGVGDDIKR